MWFSFSVARIYRSLRCGQAASVLGFQPDRIIVSGESVGGNLAASLCVTIFMDYNEGSDALLTPSRSMELVSDRDDASSDAENEEADGVMSPDSMIIELPDALMMCCPMLNMSLDSTPSRLDGANDPVLPSGLIAAISNTYLPVGGEFPKNHPVASPYFATDAILRKFPPTLIFTSSGDPFLDDQGEFYHLKLFLATCVD